MRRVRESTSCICDSNDANFRSAAYFQCSNGSRVESDEGGDSLSTPRFLGPVSLTIVNPRNAPVHFFHGVAAGRCSKVAPRNFLLPVALTQLSVFTSCRLLENSGYVIERVLFEPTRVAMETSSSSFSRKRSSEDLFDSEKKNTPRDHGHLGGLLAGKLGSNKFVVSFPAATSFLNDPGRRPTTPSTIDPSVASPDASKLFHTALSGSARFRPRSSKSCVARDATRHFNESFFPPQVGTRHPNSLVPRRMHLQEFRAHVQKFQSHLVGRGHRRLRVAEGGR